MNLFIEEILARKIFDSRGNPTIEVEVYTDEGSYGVAAAPAGASTGSYEAVVIGVDDAINKLESDVRDQLIGENSADQEEIDRLLHEIDGTDNFANIGGNTAVAVSMATAKAAANSFNLPLYRYLGGPFPTMPFPLGNVIGGGAHAKGATDIQEFLVTPIGAPTIDSAVEANTLVHKRVKKILTETGIVCGKGDEGGWAPQIRDSRAFEIVHQAVSEVSDELGFRIRFGLDVAATELWDGTKYIYKDAERSVEEQIHYIAEMVDKYELYYVEDPLQENDYEGFAQLTDMLSDRCLICGDDLFVTNAKRIAQGIENVAANAVLIKPNQIGTVTDTYKAIMLARKYGYATIMSHRSGETCDNTIAHLATAFGCELLKCGVVGGERMAKLNELIRTGEEIGSDRMTESPL